MSGSGGLTNTLVFLDKESQVWIHVMHVKHLKRSLWCGCFPWGSWTSRFGGNLVIPPSDLVIPLQHVTPPSSVFCKQLGLLVWTLVGSLLPPIGCQYCSETQCTYRGDCAEDLYKIPGSGTQISIQISQKFQSLTLINHPTKSLSLHILTQE